MSKSSFNGNANFAIDDSTFYDPESQEHYPYKIITNSIKIEYEDGRNTLSFKFKGDDTLIMKGRFGVTVYWRVKK